MQPRLTECVAWIGGRTDVLASLFVLAALVTWRPRRARRWAAAALLLLGLLSKEVAVAGMVAVAALEWRARAQGSPRRWAVRAVVPLGAAALAYTALRVAATGASVMKVSESRLGRRLAAMLEATGSYAWRFVDAWRPRLQSPLGGPSDLVLVALDRLRAECQEQVDLIAVRVQGSVADADLNEVVATSDAGHIVLQAKQVQSPSG